MRRIHGRCDALCGQEMSRGSLTGWTRMRRRSSDVWRFAIGRKGYAGPSPQNQEARNVCRAQVRCLGSAAGAKIGRFLIHRAFGMRFGMIGVKGCDDVRVRVALHFMSMQVRVRAYFAESGEHAQREK